MTSIATLGPLMVDVAGLELTFEDRQLLLDPAVGSVILFSRNYRDPEQVTSLVRAIQALRSPALLIAVDQEGGRVQRFRSGFTALPPLRSLGRRYDLDRQQALGLARMHAWLMASEVRECGVDFSFAPCVDLDFGVSDVIGDRAFHSDASAVAALAVAYIGGMRDAGMAATAKHFPGHGAVVGDSHVALPVDRRSLADLEADIAPYRLLFANHLAAVMAAHVAFPSVDDLPASLSRRWIQGVLRDELHFHGCVFADDLSMGGAVAFGDIDMRVKLALDAGCDVLPICNDRAAALRAAKSLQDAALDPVSAARRVRMRGRPPAQHSLRSSATWHEAVAKLAALSSPPPLELVKVV